MAYQPIRWDNVPGSSLSEASRPLDAAARAFDMGFGAVRGVLDQRSAIQDQNFAAGVKNNTNEVMNRLMGADSVDAFNAAKQGLGATLDGYGASIDQQAIRNFADQRGSVLQDRAIKTIDFNHKTLDEAQAKDRDRIAGMLNSGDKTQIDAAMKELPNMDLRVKADLYKNGNEAQRQLIERAHVDQEHDWKGQLNAANIQRMKDESAIGYGNLSVNRGQLGVAQRNATVNEANAMMLLDQRLEDRDAKYRQEYANTFKNEAGSLAGQAVIDDAISNIKDPNDQKQARVAAAEIIKSNPKSSTNAVVASIKGIDASWALDILERSAAARNAAKMNASGAGAQDAAYAEELRKTLAAKIATNQGRRDALSSGGLGLGDRGTGAVVPASAPTAATVPNPFDGAQSLANAAQAAAPANATDAPVAAQAQAGNPVAAPRHMSIQEQVLAAQADQKARNNMIADHERLQAAQELQAKTQRQLADAQRAVEAINAVTDKNPNKAPLLERAKAERDRLKALLGN
jgi:hypothetical protein